MTTMESSLSKPSKMWSFDSNIPQNEQQIHWIVYFVVDSDVRCEFNHLTKLRLILSNSNYRIVQLCLFVPKATLITRWRWSKHLSRYAILSSQQEETFSWKWLFGRFKNMHNSASNVLSRRTWIIVFTSLECNTVIFQHSWYKNRSSF